MCLTETSPINNQTQKGKPPKPKTMSKFAILSVASIALGAMGVSIPQQQPTKATVGRWSKITSMPASRYNFAASLFANGDVFVGLGEDTSTYSVSSSFRWSRTTGVWAPLARATSTLTTRRDFGVYTTPSDAIRVVGGSHGSSEYLKTTSQLADGAVDWTNNALPDMSIARYRS